MSTDSPSVLRPVHEWAVSKFKVLAAWLVIVVATVGFWRVFNGIDEAIHKESPTPKSSANSSTGDSSQSALLGELAEFRRDSRQLSDRFSQLENRVEKMTAAEIEKKQIAESDQAVRKAKLLAFNGEVNTAKTYLGEIRKLRTAWMARETELLQGEEGRRISGSPQHLELVVELWQRERPSLENIVQWEAELNALSEVLPSATDEQTELLISQEHSTLVTDLGQKLRQESNEFKRQVRLLESIVQEVSGLKPASIPLGQAMERFLGQQDKAEAERLAETKRNAKAAAERASAEQIAQRETELADTETRYKEQILEGKKQELEAKTRAAQEAQRWAQLESEMQLDLDEIQGLLISFTSPGYTYRPDNTKGPVSYSLIRSNGGLNRTRKGLEQLFYMARGNSDRIQAGLPPGNAGTISSATPVEPIERAQELLIKYGELMVKKGMLAP
jgi:hypothetical protein